MKKTLSTLIAVLIVVCTVLALASCGSGGSIVGKWAAKLDFEKALAASGEEAAQAISALGADLSGYSVDLNVEFKEDGKYTASVDKDQLKEVMREMMNGLLDTLVSQMGISIDDYLQMAGYSSVDEALDAMMEQSGDSLNGMSAEGDYTYENGTLKLGNSEIKAEVAGNKLTFTEIVKEGDSAQMFPKALLPLVFDRK